MPKHGRAETIKDACVEEAFRIIEADGLEALSLREVARRIGVSHQAPYKHFPSRDHILAEVAARCYADFARHLEARPQTADDWDDLAGMGLAYLSYARENPLRYRLMFTSTLPPAENHPDMMANAKHAFSLLCDRLSTMTLRSTDVEVDDPAKHDAIFIWSCLHGLVSLMQSQATDTLALSPQDKNAAIARLMARLSLALRPG
ncbi:MAG: TetR/AcrR family transcriptional regulator [Pseudomonadota bacterium]